MTLRNNDTQSVQLRKKTVQRFSFVVNAVGAGTLANLALELVNVKMTLKRGGRDYILAHDNLQVLAQESSFFQGFEHALSKTGVTISSTLKYLPLMIDLGSPINLFGSDELDVEVTTKTGWYGDFDAAQSSIEVEAREAIGVEGSIPLIRTRYISATHSRVQESLGDFISSITLLNTEDARSNSAADHVWDSVIITSDKWNCSDNRGRLLARRASQFQLVSAAAARKENFRYVPNVNLDGVEITIELNGANVVATKNAIVVRSFLPTKETVARFENTQRKHSDRNKQKLVDALSQ